jgi:hypothetical protein
MIKINAGRFHNIECATQYAHRQGLRALARKKAKADKEFKAETKQRKEAIKSLPELAREAQTVVNKYVRLRDINEGCISCDKPPTWAGQWHASHFYSRGHSSYLRFNLLNIHKSCSVCNSHLSGNIGAYRPWLIEKIGQAKYDWLEANKSRLAEHDREYLVRIKKVFAKRCRLLTNK